MAVDATNSPQREAAEEYFRNKIFSLFQDDFLLFRTSLDSNMLNWLLYNYKVDKLDANLK